MVHLRAWHEPVSMHFETYVSSHYHIRVRLPWLRQACLQHCISALISLVKHVNVFVALYYLLMSGVVDLLELHALLVG